MTKAKCECCAKPAKAIFFMFEPTTTFYFNNEESGGIEVIACGPRCAREAHYGTANACPQLPTGAKIVRLDDEVPNV